MQACRASARAVKRPRNEVRAGIFLRCKGYVAGRTALPHTSLQRSSFCASSTRPRRQQTSCPPQPLALMATHHRVRYALYRCVSYFANLSMPRIAAVAVVAKAWPGSSLPLLLPLAPPSQVAALMRLGLFQAALRGASPEAARALMQQLLAAQRAGTLSDEAVADVALAYLELKAPQPPLRQPSADGQEGQEEEAAAAAAAVAALDAVPPAAIGLIIGLPVERCRRQLCALARRSPPLLGQVLSVSDPRPLLAEGLLAPEDLLEVLQQPPGSAGLPALAAVAAAAALLAAAPPGPSAQLLSLVRVLAESHLLLAIVEAGHLAPATLRAALQAADGPTFTDIFKVGPATLLCKLCVMQFVGQGRLVVGASAGVDMSTYATL